MQSVLSRAVGFFRKDTPVEEFLEGVVTVLNGGSAVGRGLREPALAALSEQERAVLTMSARRHSLSAIAAALGISKDAVRALLDGAYRRLGLHGREQAIRWSTKMGLTEVEPATRD
jgi:DNA-binding CsgD family transcriptional regulator